MLLRLEKMLLAKKFFEIKNDITGFQYARKDDETTQISINHNSNSNKWEVSFPLTHSPFNYKTKFTDYDVMRDYVLQRLIEFS
jgi:hypothetical protein